MKRLAVFCASSEGLSPAYMEAAYETGKMIAENKLGLVYGGASVGCMGAVAQGALDSGGEVIGVLPHFLNKREIAHQNLQDLILVDSMHERKLRMHELSDASITLPGGFGTLEEFFEIITWGQLGLHQKPNALLNVNAYYDHLIQQLEHMSKEGLLKREHLKLLLVETDPRALLNKIRNYTAPEVPAWLKGNKQT